MSATTTGVLAGILLALVVAVGGWDSFFLALLLGAIGAAVGAQVEGKLDLSALLPGRSRG